VRVKLLLSLTAFRGTGRLCFASCAKKALKRTGLCLSIALNAQQIRLHAGRGHSSLPITATRHLGTVNLVLDIPWPFLPTRNGCRFHYRAVSCPRPLREIEVHKNSFACCELLCTHECSGMGESCCSGCVASLVAVPVSRDCEGASGKH
jgi:hypothetical protein